MTVSSSLYGFKLKSSISKFKILSVYERAPSERGQSGN